MEKKSRVILTVILVVSIALNVLTSINLYNCIEIMRKEEEKALDRAGMALGELEFLLSKLAEADGEAESRLLVRACSREIRSYRVNVCSAASLSRTMPQEVEEFLDSVLGGHLRAAFRKTDVPIAEVSQVAQIIAIELTRITSRKGSPKITSSDYASLVNAIKDKLREENLTKYLQWPIIPVAP